MRLDDLRLWRSPLTGRVYVGFVKGNVATSKVDVTEQFDALAGHPNAQSRAERQRLVGDWVATTFGADSMAANVRLRRFFEEAVELAQAVGMPQSVAEYFVDIVYARPRGEASKEVGQAGLTLLALGAALGVAVDDAEELEWHRVQAKSGAEWRERRDAKVFLGLSVVPSTPPTDGEGTPNG